MGVPYFAYTLIQHVYKRLPTLTMCCSVYVVRLTLTPIKPKHGRGSHTFHTSCTFRQHSLLYVPRCKLCPSSSWSSSQNVCPFLVMDKVVHGFYPQADLFNHRWHSRLLLFSSYFSPLLGYQIWCWEKYSQAWREEPHSSVRTGKTQQHRNLFFFFREYFVP